MHGRIKSVILNDGFMPLGKNARFFVPQIPVTFGNDLFLYMLSDSLNI